MVNARSRRQLMPTVLGVPLREVEKRPAKRDDDASLRIADNPIRRANIAGITQKRRCAWCGEWFTPARDWQKFCGAQPNERQRAHDRKQALVGALARQFSRLGWGTTENRLIVARKCIEAEYEAVFAAMVHLGWRYDESLKVWLIDGQCRRGART